VAASGVIQAQAAFEGAAKRVAGTTGDSVDLSTDAVGLIQAKDAFEGSIGVLKAADEVEKATLSLLG
jgi:hypothetical protein